MRKNGVKWQHTLRHSVLNWRDLPHVVLPLRKSLHCSGSRKHTKLGAVIVVRLCATGSSSSISFSMASWRWKKDDHEQGFWLLLQTAHLEWDIRRFACSSEEEE